MEIKKSILKAYPFYLHEVREVTHRVSYAKTRDGTELAIKKIPKDSEEIHQWIFAYQQARSNRLQGFMPVYTTPKGEPFTQDQDHFYYVMPWIHEIEENEAPLKKMLQALARIHKGTQAESDSEIDESIHHLIQNEHERVKQEEPQWEKIVSYYEQKHYISPNGFLLLMNYPLLMESRKSLDYWYDQWERDEEEHDHLRTVLCHGNLRLSHFKISQKRSYLFSWEKSQMAVPIYDLLRLLRHLFLEHDLSMEQVISAFEAYESIFPLSKREKYLLGYHLSQPFWFTKQYLTERKYSQYSSLSQTRKIQRRVRQLSNSIAFQSYLKSKLSEQTEASS
ncbi:phosphotransferase [Bacillaceae bacterium S4-13-56]